MLNVFSWTDGEYMTLQCAVGRTTSTPAQSAASTIAALTKLPPGQRVINPRMGMLVSGFTHTAFDLPLGNPGTHGANIVAAYERGPQISVPQKWTRDFYQRLSDAHAVPDWIVLDEENGWNLSQPPYSVITSPQFYEMVLDSKHLVIPDYLKEFTPDDFAGHSSKLGQASNVFNRFLRDICNTAIRTVHVTEAHDVFGVDIASSNFDDTCVSFPVYDINNNPRLDAQVRVGSWASPALYLLNGWRGSKLGQKKNPFWNRLIDCVNIASSALNHTANVAPWISYPTYRGDDPGPTTPWRASMQWLWTQLVELLHAAGVTTFLYWNPSDKLDVATEQHASGVFKTLEGQASVRRQRTEIPQDAESITIGDVTVKYSSFDNEFWRAKT